MENGWIIHAGAAKDLLEDKEVKKAYAGLQSLPYSASAHYFPPTRFQLDLLLGDHS
jgi:hypothetical protein